MFSCSTVICWINTEKKCVAVLIGLCKKNCAVSHVRIDLLLHTSDREGCGHALVSLNIRSVDGRFSVETATHSVLSCS